MELKIYPDGPAVDVPDEAAALAAGLPGQLVLDCTRFLRRDVTGAPLGFVERPPVAAALDLLPHPEGGWFRETWRTSATVEPPGYAGPRATATGIYFLLNPGEESVPHTVRSDEVWFWHRGGPLSLTIGEATVTLGPGVEDGQVPQAVVPGGVRQSARPAAAEPVLVSCVVSPGFDFADFTA
ncbi:cupin domain-containing protein [Actinomadura sp. ATCC 31491]|uniref:Cupin domain-containing protein n=1 Tax=Actinomadura luzonensis TaxID=2805427 RepID=A0ABT0FY84_9ACTN|nr:cupin domain-containing protein [Actinomadura luzonensis]MCK2217313.1 cupin domain-containing protein [Actinomadura luzonensis]